MSEWADFAEKSAKTCFVVLEELDEKVINQYLQKCGLKKTTKNVESIERYECQSLNKNIINSNDCFKTKKNPKEIGIHKRKNSEDSVLKNELTRKKRKTKTLDYTDDVSNKNESNKEEFVTENDKIIKLCVISDADDNRKESFRKLKKTYENDKSITMKCKEKSALDIEDLINNISLKIILEDSDHNKTENHVVNVSNTRAGTEIEIVEEYLNVKNILLNKSYKTETICNKEQLLINNNSAWIPKLFEEEYDSREDNEDDKKTVIFGEGFYIDRDSDFFDIDEKEIELARKKLKKRKITNPKIQKLIQCKRKEVNGKNSEAMKKSETKIMEPSITHETTEVLPLPENISEDCLKEVCCLVQRLHELYKVILHMQMELENENNKLSVNFSSAINAHQEQFQKEIRKSQKTIIKVYEKMLLSYKNAGKVALIISERTSMSAKEVIEVISQCLLVEGACEFKKSKDESIQTGEKEKNSQPPRASCNSNSSRKIINEGCEGLHVQKIVQKKNYLMPPSKSYTPPKKNSELCQRAPNKSMRTPTIDNSNIHSPNQSNRVIGNLPPKRQMQTTEHGKPRSYLMQKKSIQKLKSKSVLNSSEIGQSPPQTRCQRLVMLPYSGLSMNGLTFPNQSVILPYPKFDCPTNVYRLQQGNLFTMPSTPGRNTELPFPGQFQNCHSKNLTSNYEGSSNSNVSNSGSRVLIPLVAGNIVQYNILPYQSNLVNRTFPAQTYNVMVNSQRQILTSNETLCPLNFTLIDAAKFPNTKFVNFVPNGSLLHSEVQKTSSSAKANLKTELRNVPSRIPEDSTVFDPTIPKKLTMKNWKLQAGPILNRTEEEKVTESRDKLNPLKEKKLGLSKLRNPNKEDSKSREYVCAQTGCKKPGVRICRRCQSIIYCSETCQLKNWTQKHMVECYQLKELRG